MVKKRSDTSRSLEPAQTDDLKLINGIGPAVERRLHGVGIYTYAQLAALSPADIAAAVAGLAGLSAERISKQDWIGQARRLAAGSKLTGPQEPMEAEPAPPAVPEPEPVTLAVTSPGAKEAEITPPVAAVKGSGGVLRILKMEVVSADTKELLNLLSHDQPFNVRLTLDLTGVMMPVDTQFNYKAYIFCKSLEGHPRQAAGEASGIITFTDSITINVKGIALPKGSTFLQALVTLWPITTETTSRIYLQAWSDRSLLMVI